MSRREKIVEELPKTDPDQRHNYLKVDFSNYGVCNQTITNFFHTHNIDILVNNTNGPKAAKPTQSNTEDYPKAFELLFKTVCQTTMLAPPHMQRQGFGRIINVSSISFREPIANLVLSNRIRSATAAWAKP